MDQPPTYALATTLPPGLGPGSTPADRTDGLTAMADAGSPPPRQLFGPEHVRRYQETGGREGHDWRGASTLILTTIGRSSGRPRPTPLIYGRSGDAFVVMASKGGASTNPDWYINLEHRPEAEIQVWDRHLTVRARTSQGEERDRLWRRMAELWPAYDEYQTRTRRQIPVVVLEPVPTD